MMAVLRLLNKMHLILLLAVLLVMSCGASSLPVSYYILNPMDYQASAVSQDPSGAVVLGIGPIHLPAYLDRPQIVSRTGMNQLKVDDFHRWAAPLAEEISRILSENLEQLTGIQRQEIYPWRLNQRPDLAVQLEIQAFEGQPDGSVLLDGTLILHDWRHNEPRSRSRTLHITQQAPSGDYPALVAAQSLTLAELSRQIAGGIVELISK